MIPRRILQEIPLGSLQPVEKLTTQSKRSKFLIASWTCAVLALLSLLFFPGETQIADGTLIPYISVPFVASYIQVPSWYKQAFAGMYFGLLLLTIVLLFLARKYRKIDR